MNTTRQAPRAVAFVFAIAITIAALAGVDRLAVSENAAVQLAQAAAVVRA